MKIQLVNMPRAGKQGYWGAFAPSEEALVRKYANYPCLHLFSGMSEIGDIRVDINPNSKANVFHDVFAFLETNSTVDREFGDFESVVYDAPYSRPMQEEYAKRYELDPDTMYHYSYFGGMDKRTHALHDAIQKMSPRYIIVKCWTVAPWRSRGYVIKELMLGCWGGLRPMTVLAVFERAGKRLDSFV